MEVLGARCLCRVVGRGVADECRHPTIDLPGGLRWAMGGPRATRTLPGVKLTWWRWVRGRYWREQKDSAGGPTLLVLFWPRLQLTPRGMSCCSLHGSLHGSLLQTETHGGRRELLRVDPPLVSHSGLLDKKKIAASVELTAEKWFV